MSSRYSSSLTQHPSLRTRIRAIIPETRGIQMTPEPPGQNEGRRAHKKSKTGCLTCKRRHVKCDEARPRCAKCTLGNRNCSYAAPPSQESDQAGLNTNVVCSASNSPAGTSSSAAWLAAVADARPPATVSGRYDTAHMNLLYYAITNMSNYMGAVNDMSPVIENALSSAHVAPCLLDQLLALSALYQSTIEQQQPHHSLFLQYATELQTRALGQFLEVRENISEVNSIPAFLFTTFVGTHVLYNTLKDHKDNLGDFIGAFVDYARVHRGIRAVTADYWDQILGSNLASLMGIVQVSNMTEHLEAGIETIELRKQLESTSGSSRFPVAASIDALQRMQWVIDLANHNAQSFGNRIQAALAWPIVISDEYIHALYLRHPEALAVLAFFLAFLYETRSFWIFNCCDGSLIEALANHLGPFWKKGLSWPLSIVAGS